MEASRPTQAEGLATIAGLEALQQAKMQPTPVARPVVLDITNPL